MPWPGGLEPGDVATWRVQGRDRDGGIRDLVPTGAIDEQPPDATLSVQPDRNGALVVTERRLAVAAEDVDGARRPGGRRRSRDRTRRPHGAGVLPAQEDPLRLRAGDAGRRPVRGRAHAAARGVPLRPATAADRRARARRGGDGRERRRDPRARGARGRRPGARLAASCRHRHRPARGPRRARPGVLDPDRPPAPDRERARSVRAEHVPPRRCHAVRRPAAPRPPRPLLLRRARDRQRGLGPGGAASTRLGPAGLLGGAGPLGRGARRRHPGRS